MAAAFTRNAQGRILTVEWLDNDDSRGTTWLDCVRSFSRAVIATVLLQSMVVVSVVLLSASAQAAEQEIAPTAPPPPPLAATPGVPFDIAFGIAFTTDYVSRGITNSNSEPAIRAISSRASNCRLSARHM